MNPSIMKLFSIVSVTPSDRTTVKGREAAVSGRLHVMCGDVLRRLSSHFFFYLKILLLNFTAGENACAPGGHC